MTDLTVTMTAPQRLAYANALHAEVTRRDIRPRLLPGGMAIALSLNK